jgi:hypothetical protein
VSFATLTVNNEIENLRKILRDHQRRGNELMESKNALLKENQALQKSSQDAKKEARQLDKILRSLTELVAEADESTKGPEVLRGLHSISIKEADGIEELLLSVQHDWSGRGSHAEFKRGETLPLEK